MKKVLLLVSLLSLPSFAATSNVTDVAKVSSFPVAHPVKTLRGLLLALRGGAYGAIKVAAVVTDSAELAGKAIAKSTAEIDAAVDKVEDAVKP